MRSIWVLTSWKKIDKLTSRMCGGGAFILHSREPIMPNSTIIRIASFIKTNAFRDNNSTTVQQLYHDMFIH